MHTFKSICNSIFKHKGVSDVKITTKQVFLVLVLLILSFTTLLSDELREIRLKLKWEHQFQFAGYYAAIEKGFYKDIGLNVQLLSPTPERTPFQTVLDGDAEFGTSTTDIMIARANGDKVVVLATIFQHSPHIFITKANSGLHYAQDLSGKRIAIEPGADELIAFLIAEGVDLNDCIIEDYDYDYSKLIKDEVDAITSYSTDEPFSFQQKEVEVTYLHPASAGIDFYGDLLFTSERLVDDDPELVKEFREASLKGWLYAMENQKEIAHLIYSKYSKRHSIEHLLFEAKEMQKLILPNIVPVGYSNPGRWNAILDTYQKLGRIDSNFTTNGLVYIEELEHKIWVHWKLLTTLLVALLTVLTLLYIFIMLNLRLRKEITRRKIVEANIFDQDEELRAKNKELVKLYAEKDKFFSIIAHDLRSPFNAFFGFTEILSTQSESMDVSEIKSLSESLNSSANKLYRLLENLLHWARVQRGLTAPDPETINLKELIQSCIRIFEESLERKKLKLNLQLGNDVLAKADVQMTNTIVRNLISNAIKFTNTGGSITIRTSVEDDDLSTISVIDSGIGMDVERMQNLFRIDIADSRIGTDGESSTGLGLILCKEFAELNGGTISVESEENKGSKFTLTLRRV